MTHKIIRFSLAFLFLAAGAAGFHQFPEVLLVLRILMVVAGIAFAMLVLWKTEEGQRFLVFTKEAVLEAKKVVWPSRKETLQMTGMVFVFVLVMAIFLWTTDKTLEWLLYDLLMGWKK